MLHFFRKLRHRLLESGKTKKYMAYAIGEILLVMIGILLALQVNNWNDTRKNRQDFELLFNNIEADLIANIEESNIGVNFHFRKDSIFQLIRDEKVTKKMYDRYPQFQNFLFTGWNYDLLMDNIQMLIEQEKQAPAKYQEILPLVKEFKSWVDNHQRNDVAARENVFSNQKYFSETYPWFRRVDSISVQQSIQYFTSDSLYWNRAVQYASLQKQVGNRIMRCRSLAIAILSKIQLERKKITPDDLPVFFQQYGLQPVEPLGCQETIDWKELRPYSYANYFIYNANDGAINLSVLQDGKSIRNLSLAPGSQVIDFTFNNSRAKLEIYQLNTQNQACQMRFRPVKNGFLLIE